VVDDRFCTRRDWLAGGWKRRYRRGPVSEHEITRPRARGCFEKNDRRGPNFASFSAKCCSFRRAICLKRGKKQNSVLHSRSLAVLFGQHANRRARARAGGTYRSPRVKQRRLLGFRYLVGITV
jgi:hypothetical protein